LKNSTTFPKIFLGHQISVHKISDPKIIKPRIVQGIPLEEVHGSLPVVTSQAILQRKDGS
jgi:hypothetical protein